MVYFLADKAIDMYTHIYPKLVYFSINALFTKEFQDKFPQLFPLVNLIDLGITNYYDVSGSLNISMKQLDEHEKNYQRKLDLKNQKPDTRLPRKRGNPHMKD